jgi:phosphoribosylformylglycinamidine synthase subunit PurQ / glutaminase
MKAAVLVFPASNCDRDMATALKKVTGRAPLMVWHQETTLPDSLDFVALPGGFSYGDYLRCGAMAARSPIMQAVQAYAARGGRVLGVCNGFQILTEAQLLPGALLRNRALRFLCRDVAVRVEDTVSAFTHRYANDNVLSLPIAHHDGNYFADTATLDALEAGGQVAFRYCGEDGTIQEADSPNGAARHIAGIFNAQKTILGMMPHPERAVDTATIHGTDGLALFESLLHTLA